MSCDKTRRNYWRDQIAGPIRSIARWGEVADVM